MHSAKPLKVYGYSKDTFLKEDFHDECRQLAYLRDYLVQLEAKTVVEEQTYFDRDYLAEFASFYGTSTRGYSNACKRIHVFSESFNRNSFVRVLAGSKRLTKKLQASYLGFIVVRPIPGHSFGKTVLRWFPENQENTPRVTEPSRDYFVDLLGVSLCVHGIAWQQQDTGVAACATVALWTIFQSSAFDDHHSIPTTSEITTAATERSAIGKRAFPAQDGLQENQICEAIKKYQLSPCVMMGDIVHKNIRGFNPERFASLCASYIRSGYPILILGQLFNHNEHIGGHAICAVGFRDSPFDTANPRVLHDGHVKYLYIHDDNLGPNVRVEIIGKDFVLDNPEQTKQSLCVLAPSAPDSATDRDIFNGYFLVPEQIVIAVHEDVRIEPELLGKVGAKEALRYQKAFHAITNQLRNFTFSTRIVSKSRYFSKELKHLEASPQLLGRTRLMLHEKARPFGRHLGLVRVGLDGQLICDFLVDISDNKLQFIANIHYQDFSFILNEHISTVEKLDYGIRIPAYR